MKKTLTALSVASALLSSTALAEVSEVCHALLDGRAANLLVANAPGGGYDTYARAIAPGLEQETGLRLRVVNNDAGGGLVARRLAVEASEDDIVILIENAIDLAVETLGADDDLTVFDQLDTLGILHVAPLSWILPNGTDILDEDITTLVAARGTIDDAVFAVEMVGLALGIETRIVGGYSGSSEFIAAVLRGEVDMTAMSVQTAMSRVEGNEAYVAMVVATAPDPQAPEVPALGGEGGFADIRSRGLSDDVRQERQGYARIASALSGAVRGLYVSRAVPQDVRDCLRSGVEATLASSDMRDTLEAQGRPLVPVTGAGATAIETGIREALADSVDVVAAIVAARDAQ